MEKKDLSKLYRALGVGARGPAMHGVAESVRPGVRSRELPPLDEAGLRELETLFQTSPRETLNRFRQVWDSSLQEEDVRRAIQEAKLAIDTQEHTIKMLDLSAARLRESRRLPDDFAFPGMDLNAIPIDPGDTKFETVADALGWVFASGPHVVWSSVAEKAPYRWHHDPRYRTEFMYPLPQPLAGSPLRIALFADFGTGRYHSRYIAKQLVERKFPIAIHLSDVYYSGLESEFKTYFKKELNPLLAATSLFTLMGNHEMYAEGEPFFKYIDERRKLSPANQPQEGSYFCLQGEKVQIVGIDTDYFARFRFQNAGLQEWLTRVLADGRKNKKINILLSADEPYTYGSTDLTPLYQDLKDILRRDLVDLWFWGNTHYCALFDRTDSLPFVGSCIGHGGYPYSTMKPGKPSAAPVQFLETRPRFPEWTGVRQDRGNNGYCVLEIDPAGDISLNYIDWMSTERCRVALAKRDGHLIVDSVTLGK